MNEQVDAVVRLQTEMAGGTSDLEQASKLLADMATASQKLKNNMAVLDQTLIKVGRGIRGASTVQKTIGIGTQGTLGEAVQRAGAAAIVNKAKSDPTYLAADVQSKRLAIDNKIVKSAQDLLTVERAIRDNDQLTLGIIEQKNLATQKTLALRKLISTSAGANSPEAKALTQEILLIQDKIAALKQEQLLASRPVKTQEQPNYLKKFEAHGGADILMIQARIMAGYKLLSSAYQSVGFVTNFIVDFDKSLTNLQAITQTTNREMMGLRSTLMDVSKSTKFSAVELSDAALTMAQAGLSTQQIKESIGGVAALATASGTDLATSVDVVTSAMNVFGTQASGVMSIVNQMTAALNQSKLNMNQLQLAIQYASNIAADSHIPFSEMIASFGAIADAGIRSGSSIGTGYRQLILDLKDPSDKLITRLAELGLSLNDISVDSKGLVGVMKTLAEAGFTTSDAMKTMEVRGASIFAALSGNLDSADLMRKAILASNDAAKAQEIQMNSLANIGGNLAAVYGSLAADAFAPLVSVIKVAGQALAEFGKLLGEFPVLTQAVVTGFSLMIGGGLLVWAGKLIYNFTQLTKVMAPLMGAIRILTGLWATYRTTATAAMAAGWLTAAVNPVGAALTALAVVIGGVTAAWYAFSDSTKAGEKSAEDIQTALDQAKGKVDQYSQAVEEADGFIKELTTKSVNLRQDQDALNMVILEAQQKFNGLSTTVINAADSYDTLLDKIQQIRDANINKQIQALTIQAFSEGDMVRQRTKELQDVIKDQKVNQFRRAWGGNDPSTNSDLDPATRAVFKDSFKTNKTDISALLALRGRVAELQDLKGGKGISPQDNEELANLASTLNEAIIANKNLESATIAQTQTVMERTRFEKSKPYASANKSEVVALSKAIDANLAKLSGKGSTSLEERRAILAEIDSSKKRLESIQGFLSKKDGGSQAIKSLRIPEILKYVADQTTTTMRGVQDEGLRRGDLEAKKADQQYRLLAEKLGATDSGVSASDKAELRRLRLESANREIAIQIAKSNAEVRTSVMASGGSLAEVKTQQEAAATTIRQTEMDKAEADLQKTLNRQNSHVRQFDEETLTPLETALTRFKNAVEQASIDFENRKYAAEAPRRALEAKQEAQNSYGQSNRVTASQREITQRELDKLGVTQVAAQLTPLKAYAEELQRQIDTARAELKAAQADQQQFASQAAAASNNDVRSNSKKKADRAASQAQQLNSEILSTSKNLDDINRQIDELLIKKGELDKDQGPTSLGQTVEEWLKNLKDKLTNGDSVFKQIDAGLTQTFESANSSLATMVKDTVTGTKSMKDAFRSFGISVVDTMMGIAAQMAANSILSSILGAGFQAAVGAGIGGTAGATPNANAGTFNFDLNGVRMASGGMVSGGIPNRDSVPTLLMPGEFVLKRSAVQALGEDTLNQLNMGMRNAANSNATMASRSSAMMSNNSGNTAVNVYVVSDKGSVPALGPNDIVAVVSDNIARGGSIKQLIKQVVV